MNAGRFRRANDQLELAADRMGLRGPVPFICECSDLTCMDVVSLDTLRYEDVRYHPRRFLTMPGHEKASVDAGVAVVAGEFADYVLIDAIGHAGEIAEQNYDDDLA